MARVVSIKSYRIEGSGKPFGRHVQAEVVETAVGAFRPALPGKHTGGVFPCSLKGIKTSGIWKPARDVFLQTPAKDIPPAAIPRQDNFGDLQVRKGLRMGFDPHLFSTDLKTINRFPVSFFQGIPLQQQVPVMRIEVFQFPFESCQKRSGVPPRPGLNC